MSAAQEPHATPEQATRAELEATFRRTYALHPNDSRTTFEQARDAVMGAADAYAQAVAQADLLLRLRTVLLDLRTQPVEARIQALHLLDAAASPPATVIVVTEADDYSEPFDEAAQRLADLQAHVSGQGGPSPAWIADDTAGIRDDFTQDRHADLDAGEFGGAMTDADYYDRIAMEDQ